MAKDPFDQKDSDDEKEANESAKEDLKKNDVVEEAMTKVDVDDDDDDGEEEASPRQQKKDNRWAEHKRARREAEERAKRAEEMVAAQQQQVQQMMQVFASQRQAPPPPKEPEVDPEIERIEQQQQYTVARYHQECQPYLQRGMQVPQEIVDKYQGESFKLQRQYQAAFVRQEMKRMQPQGEEPHRAAMRAALTMQYPDVMGNEQAYNYANSLFQAETHAGRQGGPELIKECMAAARKRFRMTPSAPEPSDGARRKFMGSSAGGGGSPQGPRTVSLTPEQIKMAKKAYPYEKPQVAIKRWVKDQGM